MDYENQISTIVGTGLLIFGLLVSALFLLLFTLVEEASKDKDRQSGGRR